MKPLMIEQLKELNSIYCLVLLRCFGKINFRKIVLANFILKYPSMLKKLDSNVKLTELEEDNLAVKEKFKFHDSWDKLTFDSLKILICKKLASFDKNKEDIIEKTELTNNCFNKVAKFEEFDKIVERAIIIKKIFNKKSEEEIIHIING